MTELPEDPRVREALGHAMKRLARSDRLAAELAADLGRRGYGESEIGEVLKFLSRNRLIDDTRTIESRIEFRSGRRAVGREKIRAELLRLGAPESSVEERLATISDDDEMTAMLQVLNSRQWHEGGRIKAARFLLSRGFSEDLVESALNRHFGSD